VEHNQVHAAVICKVCMFNIKMHVFVHSPTRAMSSLCEDYRWVPACLSMKP
jgi:hypothetical protein